MKNRILFAAALLATALAVSCSDNDSDKANEPYLTVSPRGDVAFTAGAAGESRTFTVSTNQPSWDAVSDKDWCVVTKSGNGFTLTALPNMESTAAPAATVTVSAGDAADVTITAAQAGRTETDVFSGYITHDGETKAVVRGAFYHQEGDGYRLHLSWSDPDGTEIYETPDWLAIDMPEEFMGTELDMETDQLLGQSWVLYIDYCKRLSYCDFFNGRSTAGTIKVSKADGSNHFEVELNGMELRDGTILSCHAAGVIDTEYDDYYEMELSGETDLSFGGTDFTGAYLGLYYYGLHWDDYYNTDIYIWGYDEEDRYYSLYFETRHAATRLSSGTYSFSTENADKTFSVYSRFFYETYDEENGWDGTNYNFTAGSFDLEISDYYCKLTLNGDIETADPEVVIPTATFTFDYTDIYTRSRAAFRPSAGRYAPHRALPLSGKQASPTPRNNAVR